MAEYEYTGPGPVPDDEGGIVRPGDVREFDAEPPWGPWRLLDEPEPEPEKPAPPPAGPPAASAAPPAPVTTPAAPPAASGGK